MIIKEKIGGKFFNLRFKIQSSKVILLLAILFCFASNIFSQDFTDLAEKLKNGSTEEKREALFQIRNLQTIEASQIAIPALQDKNEIVRVTAVSSVIFLPPDEAARFLLPLLKDKSVFVRKETALALGKTRSISAVQSLLEILERDKVIEVKTFAAIALGEIGDVSAINGLLKILRRKIKNEEDFLRRSASRSIGQIAQIQQVKVSYTVTPESLLPEKYDTIVNLKFSNLAEKLPIFQQVIPDLLKVLQNPKEADDVRRETAFTLGTIGDQSVIGILQSNLSSKDYYLVEICKEGLVKLTNQSNFVK